MARMIGIDIGSNLLKLVITNNGEVEKIVAERVPENLIQRGKIAAPGAMSDFLKQVCKDNGIRPGPCALVLPPEIVMAHKVTMPFMNEKELMLNLPFEFRDFVGTDSSKFDYDYSVIEVRDKVMTLYAAAVAKDVVEEYYSVLRKAGFTLRVATPIEMALQNLIRRADSLPAKLCILDAGHSITRVSIYSNGCYEMGRDIELGGRDVDNAIADFQQVDPYMARTRKEADMDDISTADCCSEVYADISVEVMRIVNFYRGNAAGGFELQDIYYCGGSSLLKSLKNAVLKRTNLTMHHIARIIPAKDGIDEDELLFCALAAGAALQKQ